MPLKPISNSPTQPIFRHQFVITSEFIDENGHVNNVHYVQWMQDAAVRHYEYIGGISPTQSIGATWVVRSHRIEYFSPAFEGDLVEVRTWVSNLRRVRSLRRYEFLRVSDGQRLATGETDWIFVDSQKGFPLSIPENVKQIFPLLPDGEK